MIHPDSIFTNFSETILSSVDHYKHLGITFSNKLTSNIHITVIFMKAKQVVNMVQSERIN